ncbi:hypothetical protein Vadar_019214 [Vaccinium darrowii]|uniref:Uncharacterized protein n=1 Tax=Vaccinium darrowii TaxID=229202 RepID=A0ACB7XJB5_9ERIC|nr:hypothetical protein Vadar_019214 [Vaccinium darrowii]
MQFFGGSEYISFIGNGIAPLHTLNAHHDHKLMFGLLFSLKSLTAKMDPTSVDKGNLGVPQLPGQGCSFHSFRTNTYKLSFMESPSGIRILIVLKSTMLNDPRYFGLSSHMIILVTHPRTGDLRESLKYIYNLYVEYVVKNPLYTPGTSISQQELIHIRSQGQKEQGVSHLIPLVELAKLTVTHHPSFSVVILTTTTKPDNSTATHISRVSSTTPAITFHHLRPLTLPSDSPSRF